MLRTLLIMCLGLSMVATARPAQMKLKRKPADFYAVNAAILNSPLKNSVKANIYFGHYSEADRQRALADMNRWVKMPQFRATKNSIVITAPEQSPIEIQFKRLSRDQSEVIVNGKEMKFKLADGYRAHVEQLQSALQSNQALWIPELIVPRAEAGFWFIAFGVALAIGAWAGADALLKCDPSQAHLIYKECLVRETLDFPQEAADTAGSIAKTLAPEQVQWLERHYRTTNFKANEQIQKARTYIFGEDEVTLEEDMSSSGGAGAGTGAEQTN